MFAHRLGSKSITVSWSYGGEGWIDDLVHIVSVDRSLEGHIATECREMMSPSFELAVSNDFHDELQAEFETVRYVVELCGDEFETDRNCRRLSVSREDFNAVQFGDETEVELLESENMFRVHEVHSGTTPDWESDIKEFTWIDRPNTPNETQICNSE